MRIRAFIITFVVFLLFASSAEAQAEQSKPVVPNLIFTTLDGTEWSLRANRGSVVVLNFWATWCEPCRTEVPFLAKIADEMKDAGVKVAGVSVDDGGPELIRKFAVDYKINYPILLPEPGSPLANVENVPKTLLIDRDGRLIKMYTGAVPEDALREDLNKIVGIIK